MRPPVLTQRALNRATLARQLLLERSSIGLIKAVEQLAGLQAPPPHSWYLGLWSRLADFFAADASQALERRELVRLPLMRSTIHLVSAADALALRASTQPAIERQTTSNFGRQLNGLDRNGLVAAARRLVDQQPLTASELGRRLAEAFSGRDPGALAQAARAWLPMVQVPPRGLWGQSGKPRQAALATWLEGPVTNLTPEALVQRYLKAFGPASPADIRTSSGIPGLGTEIEGLRTRLDRFRDQHGRELIDLPDAPRPDADTPAPPRFLYDYDNLLLSHADRARIIDNVDYATHGFTSQSNRQPSSLLVDGFVAGTWITQHTPAGARLTIRPFRRFTAAQRDAITSEGSGVLQFLHPNQAVDIQIVPTHLTHRKPLGQDQSPARPLRSRRLEITSRAHRPRAQATRASGAAATTPGLSLDRGSSSSGIRPSAAGC